MNDVKEKRLNLSEEMVSKLTTYKNSDYSEYIEEIRHLIIFFNDLLHEKKVKENNHLLEFFEISCHSFDCSFCGKKPFEGYIMKKADMNIFRCIGKYFCCCFKSCLCGKCRRWNKRWFLLKDDMICYFNDLEDTLGKDVSG